jgi:hypothetical protein
MSRLRDLRERIHQPYFDTLTRGIGQSSIPNLFQLFGNANVGDRALTNLEQAGQFAADATYILKAVRAVLWFQGLANDTPAFGAFGSLASLTVAALGTNARAEDLYYLCGYGATFTLKIGQKQMLTAPLWYAPAGGGPAGFTTENSRSVISNGIASQEAILKLAKDIPVAVRQNFSVAVEWFPFTRLGQGQVAGGTTYAADLDPLAYVNQFDGIKLIQMFVDGVITRDVQ